jgi:Rieske Fe-S protein
MKRPLPKIDPLLNRRQFVVGATAFGVVACGQVSTPGPDNQTPDAGETSDSGSSLPPDAGAPTCPADAIGTSASPSSFTEGSPALIDGASAFIVRDSNGLYALSSICTHQGCQVSPNGSDFLCPCHQSEFDLNGNVVRGPARSPLVHYALCIESDGTVGIDTNTVVDASVRLDV